MNNEVVYELVDKVTKAVTAIIGGLVMGDGYVEANIEGGVVRFENPNKDGKLTNDTYYMREVGTHIAPDGVTNTDEEYADKPADVTPDATPAPEATPDVTPEATADATPAPADATPADATPAPEAVA